MDAPVSLHHWQTTRASIFIEWLRDEMVGVSDSGGLTWGVAQPTRTSAIRQAVEDGAGRKEESIL